MSNPRTAELAQFLFEVFVGHGVKAELDQDLVRFPDHGMATTAAIVMENEYETHATVQLDVRFEIGPGRGIVESCGGIGENVEAAVQDAKEGFLRNALHVLLGAFFGLKDHGVHQEWSLTNGPAHAFIGDFIVRGKAPQGGVPTAFFELVKAAVEKAPLGVRTHWIRVYCARTPSGDHTTEILLDNAPWPEAAASVAQFAWPVSPEFYSVRIFLVLDRGYDTARAAAVIAENASKSEEEIVQALVKKGVPEKQAIAFADFIPLAFGRPVLQKLGVTAREEAEIREGDTSRTIILREDPIFADALALAEEAYEHGTMPSEVFRALAVRSAEVDAVNQALQEGSKADDLELAPTVLCWP